MRSIFRGTVALASLALLLALPFGAGAKGSKDEGRAEVRNVAHETLAKLYQTQPAAQHAVEGAAGYAVFSNFGMKIFLVGGGKGEGVAGNNKNPHETFMKMAEVQAGLGIGI